MILRPRTNSMSERAGEYPRLDPSSEGVDLTGADLATIAKLLRDTIAAARFPLSPRVRRWQAILDKLEAAATAPGTATVEAAGHAEHAAGEEAGAETLT